MKKPWELTEEADIQSLINNKVREHIGLDYKASAALLPIGTQKANRRFDISKDVSAFANTAGGVIVYGVKENGQTYEPLKIDGGYDPGEITAEWLEQIINSNIHRRIDGIRINTIDLVTNPGRVIYVVYVPESPLAPRMAADNRFYKRFNLQSVAMDENEVRNLMRREVFPSAGIVRAWRDTVINPLLRRLSNEQSYLAKRKWTININQPDRLEELFSIGDRSTYSGNQEEFLSLNPDIQTAMDEHDLAVQEVVRRCKQLWEAVQKDNQFLATYAKYTTGDALRHLKTVGSSLAYCTTEDQVLNSVLSDQGEAWRVAYLAQFIVNEAGKLYSQQIIGPFWDAYMESFLDLLTHPPLSGFKAIADEGRELLQARIIEIHGLLKRVRSQICRQYGIPVEPLP